MKKKIFQNSFRTFLFVLSLSCCFHVNAQTKKPKVALVLSGGGAKGIAHIPLLQALDSLGIVPDIVIGTSMGSIVGGLYAMGYSGDSIAHIAMGADWDKLLGGSISLSEVSMEEKGEFGRYLVNLKIDKGKPKVNSAILKDQNLREFISVLTYPSYKIRDFDNLSIPFRAVATDIVNGEEVIIKDGSLALALRASMSIPGVFKPVPYNNTLLVDGGVLNNFPTDIARSMGYDFIIGSDVGGGMASKEELDNLATLIFQTGMLTSNLRIPENRARFNILLDHIPNLTYSTGDFKASKAIYEEGKIAAKKNIGSLSELANELKVFPQRTNALPPTKSTFKLDTIFFEDISSENIDIVKARTNLELQKEYSPQDVIMGINRAMGTNLFEEINYRPTVMGDSTAIVIIGEEKSKNLLKGSIHFDDYRGVGVIVNYTNRNLFGKASRFLVTLDIAEQQRGRIQYQKNFGKVKEWWWRSETYGEQLKQKVYVNGEEADNVKYKYFLFDNEFNKNLNSNSSFVGLGIDYNYTEVLPSIDPDVADNALSLRNYFFNNLVAYAHYTYNNLDKVFFSTKGRFINVALGRSLINHVNLTYIDPDIPKISGPTNGFLKFNLRYEERIPITPKITGIIGASAGFIFEDALSGIQNSFTQFGYGSKFFLGGNSVNPNKKSYLLNGIREDELNVMQFMNINLAMQYSPFNKIFLTPHINLASVGFEDFNIYIDDAFSPKGSWAEGIETSGLFTGGLTLSYNSILGPVHFDMSYANDIDKFRLSFSVGIPLNRSN
ncbi:MAG: patatin-like phospholipase family protein [Eudoraea sp.]|uniref:patatin-like phospholipase family protein n=1 Tax=Eudoraea sp. TaxID=1979955 RepID=UPI003C754473